MGILLLLTHIGVCAVLIMVVLLQSGKAADLAGAFGGGGSQTALGSRGAATFFTKATTTCAILFMLTSLGLSLLSSRGGGSVLESVPGAAAAEEPGVGRTFTDEAAATAGPEGPLPEGVVEEKGGEQGDVGEVIDPAADLGD